MVTGIRNRDLVAALFKEETTDAIEKRRRSARVTRLIRILRGHGLLQKVPKTHRYQVNETARAAPRRDAYDRFTGNARSRG